MKAVGALVAVVVLVAGCVGYTVTPLQTGPPLIPTLRPPAQPGQPIGQPTFPIALPTNNLGQPTVAPGQPGQPGQPGNPPGQPGGPTAGVLPDFVTPGARLTWYAAGASVAQSRYTWVEEACTGSNWRDAQTGKCYRRTDESGEGQGAGSGDGLSQLDVIAVDGRNAALDVNGYTFFRENNTFTWVPYGGSSVDGVSVYGSWIHPAELAQFLQNGIPGVNILRGTYSTAGQTFDAISSVSGAGTGNYASYTYDLQSGVLLSAVTSSAGVTSPIAAQGENPPVGNSQLGLVRFAGYRQRTNPGVDGTSPDVASRLSQLIYQGTNTIVNPINGQALSYPMQTVVTLGQTGSNWRSYTAHTDTQGLPSSDGQGIAGPAGPYWYDTQALGQMSQGRVLDQDPLTTEQVAVSYVGGDANGTQVVVIDSALPGNFQRWTYDRGTGVLLAYQLQQPSVGTNISVQLVDQR